MRKALPLVLFISLTGCNNNTEKVAPATTATQAAIVETTPEPEKPKEMTAKEARVAGLKALQKFTDAVDVAKLELTDNEIYTEENDPNKLLGRPGQYSAKMNWKVSGGDATIEVFPTLGGAKERRDYVDKISKSSPMFLQYIYLNENLNVVLRIPKEATPTVAEEWNGVFQTLKE